MQILRHSKIAVTKTGISDGTETRVQRRLPAGRVDRHKFISGEHKQNAVKPHGLHRRGRLPLYCKPG
ncbi:hypothetical protein ABZ341_13535 [Streptomyces sp. NPDC006173]|uniref:hypothetical protein n=1 Tax=Streptomyces sp. NPDC006173 TaxID=3155349 RepID=UPI0033C9ED49